MGYVSHFLAHVALHCPLWAATQTWQGPIWLPVGNHVAPVQAFLANFISVQENGMIQCGRITLNCHDLVFVGQKSKSDNDGNHGCIWIHLWQVDCEQKALSECIMGNGRQKEHRYSNIDSPCVRMANKWIGPPENIDCITFRPRHITSVLLLAIQYLRENHNNKE